MYYSKNGILVMLKLHVLVYEDTTLKVFSLIRPHGVLVLRMSSKYFIAFCSKTLNFL